MTPFKLGQLSCWHHLPEPTNGKRILMIHGLGEHSGRHQSTVNHLVDAGFEIFQFDLRGCGQSDGTQQWIEAFGDYVDDAELVYNHINSYFDPKPIFLHGHSLGGAISILLGARKSTDFAGMFLNAPAFKPGSAVSAVKIAIGRLLNRFAPRLRIPGSLDLNAVSRDPAQIKLCSEDLLNCSFNTVRQGNEILDTMPKLPEYMKDIDCPLLITHGKKDRLVLWQGTQVLIDSCVSKDKTAYFFDESYHEIHNDLNREEYFKVITDWLNQRS